MTGGYATTRCDKKRGTGSMTGTMMKAGLAILLGTAAATTVAARDQAPSTEPGSTAPGRAGEDAQRRADATLRQMTQDERTVLTHGIMPLPVGATPPPIPADAIPGAGYVGGVARLGVPALKETDASLGVAYVFGLRRDGATALPSGLAMASTWNPALIEQGGAMIGAEARAKGFNVMLTGGVNLMRDPRNGRNFEYFGEDPLLSGTLAGHAIRGIQSNHIIATIKHFALNGQETGRKFVDSRISEGAARESDLLAFQLGIEIGNPGSVMCAYNKVNGDFGLLQQLAAEHGAQARLGLQGFRHVGLGRGARSSGGDERAGPAIGRTARQGDVLRPAASRSRRRQTRMGRTAR